MDTLEFFTINDTPPEVLAYSGKLKMLGVGKAGKLGALQLGFERDKHNGKTAIKNQYSKVPLYAGRALYLEEGLPSMAYLYIVSPSGGVLQGDRYRMDISLRNNAVVHMTTQGATRLYKMDANYATQLVNVTVDENCYLEFIPDQIIPYRDSRFYQKLDLRVHDNATMIYSEMVTSGRVAMGESFEYDICYLKALAKNQNGVLRFIDTAVLEPKKRNMNITGILGNRTVVGTIYLLTKSEYISELNNEIHASLQKFLKISGGTSILPRESGIIVRMLGNFAEDIKAAIYETVKITRKKILNAPFSGIRKN